MNAMESCKSDHLRAVNLFSFRMGMKTSDIISSSNCQHSLQSSLQVSSMYLDVKNLETVVSCPIKVTVSETSGILHEDEHPSCTDAHFPAGARPV
jgi:hypothetical protein